MYMHVHCTCAWSPQMSDEGFVSPGTTGLQMIVCYHHDSAEN